MNGIFRELFKKSRHRQLLLTLKYKNSRRQTNFTSSYQWSKIVKSIGHAKIYWFHSRKIGFGVLQPAHWSSMSASSLIHSFCPKVSPSSSMYLILPLLNFSRDAVCVYCRISDWSRDSLQVYCDMMLPKDTSHIRLPFLWTVFTTQFFDEKNRMNFQPFLQQVKNNTLLIKESTI